MPQETLNSQFKALAAGLSGPQQTEFFKTLHEVGVSPKDKELASLLRALQLYKAYYESIPEAVKTAAIEIDRIKREVEAFSRDAHQSSDASARLAGQVIQEAEQVRKDLGQIHEQIEKQMVQVSEKLAPMVAESLRAGIEKSLVLPLQNQLEQSAGAGKALGDSIAQSSKAVEALRGSVEVIRNTYLWTYVICGLFISCSLALGSWCYIRWWYSSQMEQERSVLIGQVGKNRDVLLELAKSNRTLELVQDSETPDRTYLMMKNASGWQSASKYGVIEFHK
jgi:hypothetical protein